MNTENTPNSNSAPSSQDDLDQQNRYYEQDEINHGASFQDVDVKSKPSVLPQVIAGGLGLVTLIVVCAIGWNMYSKMSGQSTAVEGFSGQENISVTPVEQDVVSVDGGDKPISDEELAKAGFGKAASEDGTADINPGSQEIAPQTPAVNELNPTRDLAISNSPSSSLNDSKTTLPNVDAAKSMPATSSTPPSTSKEASSVSAPIQGADIAAVQRRLDGVDKKIESIEQSISRISKPASDTLPSHAKSSVNAGSKASVKNHASTKNVRKASAKKSGSAVTDAQTSKDPISAQIVGDEKAVNPTAHLQLRGVYPPQGENPQAWVLDTKTGAIHVVSVGALLQGLTITSITPDQVVTDKGSIR